MGNNENVYVYFSPSEVYPKLLGIQPDLVLQTSGVICTVQFPGNCLTILFCI